LKKIIFLIIASLLVIGLVVPGCEGEGPEPVVGDIVFEDGVISIGIAGELSHMTGQFQMIGATIASTNLTVNIDGEPHTIALVPIETGEATVDPLGAAGYSALLAAIDDVDFILGGFRTEAVTVYREVAVGPTGEGVIFIDCGAATEFLQHSVVDDYDNYKYWWKGTPYNEYFLAQSVLRMIDAVGRTIRTTSGNKTEDYTLRCGIVADDAVWCDDLVTILNSTLPDINFSMVTDPVRIDPLLVDPTLMGAALTPIALGDPSPGRANS
jgi:branched-chain amino acid transport system substrate-binding protein